MKESKALKHRHERREPDNTSTFVFSGLLRATHRLRATAIMYALISRKTPSFGPRHVINAIFGRTILLKRCIKHAYITDFIFFFWHYVVHSSSNFETSLWCFLNESPRRHSGIKENMQGAFSLVNTGTFYCVYKIVMPSKRPTQVWPQPNLCPELMWQATLTLSIEQFLICIHPCHLLG